MSIPISQRAPQNFLFRYGCYDNSAIATEAIGTIAHIDDKWVFVSNDNANKSYYNNDKQYHGIVITDKEVIKTLIRMTKL